MIHNQSASDLIKLLNETDESEDLEAKECANEVGKSVFETICALSNEPGLEGGTILLGVKKEIALFSFYSPTGVANPDKISSDLASACSTKFNHPIRIDIRPQKVGEVTVLQIDVPELPANQKPLYFKARGLPAGAYRRVGPTDVQCTDEDLQTFFQGKAPDPFDKRIVKDARWDDIDPTAIGAYRKSRAEANPLAEELNWTDEEMLYSLGAIQRFDGKIQITITGILVFGKASALRRLYPAHRVDYIRIPGKVWVQNPDAGFDSIDMRGPIVTIIGRLLAAVTDDLPKTLVIEDGMSGQRTETSVVPFRVLREAVVNALMHRSYETYQPIQIVRYSNRIEIKNPGYSLKSQDRFDEPGSFIRNPTIAAILHETRYAETKGSGIRVMQEKMKQSGLAAPTFESDRTDGEFRATFLFHHFLDENDWNWLAKFSSLALSEDQMRALIFVREVGAIDNSTYRDLSQLDTLAASKSLRGLVQIGLLRDRGSGAKTHYIAGEEFERVSALVEDADGAIHDNSGAIHDTIHDKPITIGDLPDRLRILTTASHMVSRLRPNAAKAIILGLCSWKPMALQEIATLMGRTPNYVSQSYIAPLIAAGELTYLYPEMIRHPNQKYQAAPNIRGRKS